MYVAVVNNPESNRLQVKVRNEPSGKGRVRIGSVRVLLDIFSSCFGSQNNFSTVDPDTVNVPSLEFVTRLGRSGRAGNALGTQHLDAFVGRHTHGTVAVRDVTYRIGLRRIGTIHSLEFDAAAAHSV